MTNISSEEGTSQATSLYENFDFCYQDFGISFHWQG